MIQRRHRTIFAALCVLGFVSISACSEAIVIEEFDEDTINDVTDNIVLKAPESIQVSACEDAKFDVQLEGDITSVDILVEGRPPLALEYNDETVSFRAPSEATDSTFAIRLVATAANGLKWDALVEVQLAAAPTVEGLAEGMVPGCAPFKHGVASGDPTSDSVFLWTRFSPEEDNLDTEITWVVSEDVNFKSSVATGTVEPTEAKGYTVQVHVPELSPDTTYFYRFSDSSGRTSALGRTRTAPAEEAEKIRLAVMSCSSIYSGFFNAYRRIAERNKLNAVIHLGDYIYDYVDQDEQVRIPTPYPKEPKNLDEWRARHAYYLSDPDLRLARAMHPWIVIWDNHDVAGGPDNDYDGSVQAFREWVPMAKSVNTDDQAYRKLSYGNLLDVVILDVLLHRNIEKVPDTDEFSILGDEQWAWLEETLTASTAAWRVFGSQKIMGTVRVDPAFRNGSEFFDTKTWDGFPADRTRFFGLLDGLEVRNNVVVSGDSHISLAQDLVDEPASMEPPYDPKKSDASVGVELLPTSISRGNFNEQVGDLPELFAYLADETMALNPHHHYLELTRHGYGILDITNERVIGEIWYSEILFPEPTESLGVSLQVERDGHSWTPSN